MVSGPNRDRVHYDDVVSTIPAVTRVEGLKHNWLSCFFAARVFGRKALSHTKQFVQFRMILIMA